MLHNTNLQWQISRKELAFMFALPVTSSDARPVNPPERIFARVLRSWKDPCQKVLLRKNGGSWFVMTAFLLVWICILCVLRHFPALLRKTGAYVLNDFYLDSTGHGLLGYLRTIAATFLHGPPLSAHFFCTMQILLSCFSCSCSRNKEPKRETNKQIQRKNKFEASKTNAIRVLQCTGQLFRHLGIHARAW